MDRRADEAAQLDVAVDHQLLGQGGPAGQAEAAEHEPSCITAPLVSAATSQCWASVIPSAEAYSSARRISGILHAVAVVGEQPNAGGRQLAERGQASPARPMAMHPAGTHRTTRRARLGVDELDDGHCVLSRPGVRHGHDGG